MKAGIPLFSGFLKDIFLYPKQNCPAAIQQENLQIKSNSSIAFCTITAEIGPHNRMGILLRTSVAKKKKKKGKKDLQLALQYKLMKL